MSELLASRLAFALCYFAFALLALCQMVHRKAIDPLTPPRPAGQRTRKLLAASSLVAALVLLVAVQGRGFGAILWVLLVSAGAFSLSLTPEGKTRLVAPIAPDGRKTGSLSLRSF